MSDPMSNRPDTTPPPQEPRKSSSPLIWILVLIALIAFAWYFYNRNAGSESISDLAPPPATSDAMTPAASSPADAEAARAAERERARKAKAAAPKPAAPRDRAAALVNEPSPTYPPEAYRAREEGVVLIRAQVDELGNASDVEIAKRSGSRILDRAALNEVRKWKFAPAIKNGKTVASSVQVPVEYKLDDQ